MRAHREAPNNPPAAARTFRLLSYKHTAPLSPLECAVPRFPTTVHSKRLTRSAKSFRMRTYEKTRGEGSPPISASQPPFTSKETRRTRSRTATTTSQCPLPLLYFQQVPTIKFSNSFLLITIQNAPGVWGYVRFSNFNFRFSNS